MQLTRGIGSSPARNHVCSVSVQPPLEVNETLVGFEMTSRAMNLFM